ncbi:hypothetical protein M0R45_019098 [Rubus argutus]|uniref:Uncharacterized protein n=1 Tax=Rubus argutus TaxID=59490 RepID=A0AAW1X4H9_RUBAR
MEESVLFSIHHRTTIDLCPETGLPRLLPWPCTALNTTAAVLLRCCHNHHQALLFPARRRPIQFARVHCPLRRFSQQQPPKAAPHHSAARLCPNAAHAGNKPSLHSPINLHGLKTMKERKN